jgi:hypothetical protein
MKRGLVALCGIGMSAVLFAAPANSQIVSCYIVVKTCDAKGNCTLTSQEIPCPTLGGSHVRFDRPNVPSKRGVAVPEGSRCTFKSKGAHAQTIQGTVHGDSCDLDRPVR